MILPRNFYNRSTLTVARELIGARLVRVLDGVKLVGLIVETEAYSSEKALACHLASKAGAAYVKTSTGFGPKGATVEDVALMRRAAEPRVRVKAAGGIHTYADAAAMIRAGADVIGTSATDAILQEAFQKAA